MHGIDKVKHDSNVSGIRNRAYRKTKGKKLTNLHPYLKLPWSRSTCFPQDDLPCDYDIFWRTYFSHPVIDLGCALTVTLLQGHTLMSFAQNPESPPTIVRPSNCKLKCDQSVVSGERHLSVHLIQEVNQGFCPLLFSRHRCAFPPQPLPDSRPTSGLRLLLT